MDDVEETGRGRKRVRDLESEETSDPHPANHSYNSDESLSSRPRNRAKRVKSSPVGTVGARQNPDCLSSLSRYSADAEAEGEDEGRDRRPSHVYWIARPCVKSSSVGLVDMAGAAARALIPTPSFGVRSSASTGADTIAPQSHAPDSLPGMIHHTTRGMPAMVTAQSQQLELQPKLATNSDNLNLYRPASLRPIPLPPPPLTLPETLGAPVIPKSPVQMENFMVLVKLYYQGAVRGMPISSDLSWDAFLSAVLAKFGHPLAGLCMEFEDEEDNNERVRLQDQTDYEFAISMAGASMEDRPEARLKIWCTDKHP